MDCIECAVCHMAYDEEGHRPRNAPCGHELCSACIRALIKESIFECPKCREKHKVDTLEDMPVCFGLINVIRAFKTMKIPLSNKTEAKASGATNDAVCNIHCKAISHWCLKCQIWICDDCIKSHSSSLGCSTATLAKAMESKKEKHLNDTDMLLTIYEEDTKFVASKIQENNKLVEEYTKLVKERNEESKNLRELLEEGKIHKEKLAESVKNLTSTKTPHAVDDGIRMLTQQKQLLQSWSVNNLGIHTSLGLPKALKDKKEVFTNLVIQNVKRHAKLSQHDKIIYLHSFLKQAVAEDSLCMPFDRVQQLISFPKEPSLVFFELTLGGVVKGRVLVRLDKGLPNIRENIVHIVTGRKGPTLSGVECDGRNNEVMGPQSLPFSELPVTPDIKGNHKVKHGDMFGNFVDGYLQHMFFYSSASPSTSWSTYCVFGYVEDGMSIIQECHVNHSKGVTLSDCGLVIEQE